MVTIDTTSEFGARVARRLNEDVVAWLTTVDADGTPQPSPIWFLWDGATFLIYSQPDKVKLRNIERNPRVALNLDGNGTGGDIVVLIGEARVAPDAPPALGDSRVRREIRGGHPAKWVDAGELFRRLLGADPGDADQTARPLTAISPLIPPAQVRERGGASSPRSKRAGEGRYSFVAAAPGVEADQQHVTRVVPGVA